MPPPGPGTRWPASCRRPDPCPGRHFARHRHPATGQPAHRQPRRDRSPWFVQWSAVGRSSVKSMKGEGGQVLGGDVGRPVVEGDVEDVGHAGLLARAQEGELLRFREGVAAVDGSGREVVVDLLPHPAHQGVDAAVGGLAHPAADHAVTGAVVDGIDGGIAGADGRPEPGRMAEGMQELLVAAVFHGPERARWDGAFVLVVVERGDVSRRGDGEGTPGQGRRRQEGVPEGEGRTSDGSPVRASSTDRSSSPGRCSSLTMSPAHVGGTMVPRLSRWSVGRAIKWRTASGTSPAPGRPRRPRGARRRRQPRPGPPS